MDDWSFPTQVLFRPDRSAKPPVSITDRIIIFPPPACLPESGRRIKSFIHGFPISQTQQLELDKFVHGSILAKGKSNLY